MQLNPCRICGNPDFRYLFDGRDRLYFLPGNFKLYRCRKCDLIQIHPQLTGDELTRFYPSNYYSYESSRLVSTPRTLREKAIFYLGHPFQALNCLLYSKLLGQNRDVHVRADSVVLDVGCGEGRYLLEKRQQGCRCYGVDISSTALQRLQRADPEIKTHCGDLWDANFPDDFFDVINLSHVLEHVAEFNRLLSETRRILKAGGSLRVQVPNVASLSFWIFGKCWMPLDVPRHVYVFSIKNLKRLFEGSGFEVVNSRTLENSFSVIGSLFYTFNECFGKKIELMRHERIWNNELVKLLFFPYSLFVNLFRIGDTMEFILRKV